eukprot:2231240-Rhodomonas_salina.1
MQTAAHHCLSRPATSPATSNELKPAILLLLVVASIAPSLAVTASVSSQKRPSESQTTPRSPTKCSNTSTQPCLCSAPLAAPTAEIARSVIEDGLQVAPCMPSCGSAPSSNTRSGGKWSRSSARRSASSTKARVVTTCPPCTATRAPRMAESGACVLCRRQRSTSSCAALPTDAHSALCQPRQHSRSSQPPAHRKTRKQVAQRHSRSQEGKARRCPERSLS